MGASSRQATENTGVSSVLRTTYCTACVWMELYGVCSRKPGPTGGEPSDKEKLDTLSFGHALLRGLLPEHPIDFGPEVSNRRTRGFSLFS